MCVRASLEEEYTNQHRNTLINGVFNAPIGEVSEICALPDATNCKIEINGEEFSMYKESFTDYCRSLDMKTGEGKRTLYWRNTNGDRFLLEFDSFVSLKRKHIMALKVRITPLDCDCEITIKSGIDGKITNTGVQHFTPPVRRVYEDGILGLYTKTIQSGVCVAVHSKATANCRAEEKYTTDRRSVYSVMTFSAKKNEAAEYEKITSYATSRDFEYKKAENVSEDKVKNDGMGYLNQAITVGYNELFEESAKLWQEYWESMPLEIAGNDFLQKCVNFARYHLNVMSSKDDSRVGIGAKGLSGEGYKGHSFWDTEIFILPYYIYTQPDTARRLLEYRYKLLKSAVSKAEGYGFKGAMYPWEGAWLDDGETCPVDGDLDLMTGETRKNMMGEIEVHISADIAYALWQYYTVTGDEDFMDKFGLEMILLTAYFWSSRVKEVDGRFEILNVIGPDEYKDDIDNNAYTNYMAYFNMKLATDFKERTVKLLKGKYDTEKIYEAIEKTIDKLYLPKPDEDGIIPAFDGYRNLKEIDISKYKNRDKVGLIFEDFGFGEIQKMQVHKQADTIMLFHLLSHMFDKETAIKNYKYYEKRTLHDSSLSMCFHALVASECGIIDEAEEMFYKACSVDVGEDVNNSDEGIHSASIGGIWLALVMGFGGVKIENGALSISPVLPDGWERYKFTVIYKGTKILVETDTAKSTVKRLSGTEKEIMLSGKRLIV